MMFHSGCRAPYPVSHPFARGTAEGYLFGSMIEEHRDLLSRGVMLRYTHSNAVRGVVCHDHLPSASFRPAAEADGYPIREPSRGRDMTGNSEVHHDPL
jgi:hypothetical protein